MNVTNYHLDNRWNMKQHQVALMLGTGHTMAYAARSVNIDKRTIYRWLENDEFRRFVEGMKSKAFDEAMGVIANTTTKAAFKLRKLIDSEDESIGLRASSEVFDTAFKARNDVKINEKMADMENKLNGVINGNTLGNRSNGETDQQASDGIGGSTSCPLPHDDEFADAFPIIKSNDEDGRVASHIREDKPRRGRPRRNGYANGNGASPGGPGSNGHSNGHSA